ncbi:toll/interleukin-1 receptor domain-containing protein [Actinokineospora pegani]|uniref:toll/interleukin-1 receptor domain-containing protein n=1 Tax=Actinokineospora pegani TaxID=2654637 RepID=UPI0018D3FECB|nr:toll/interleukin-1 receptor domain-containing protein [Actinokineospora pegani]
MSGKIAFWSYSRHDDEAEGRRIHQLALDIGEQLHLITGDRLSAWVDLDDLEWGTPWRETVDDAVTAVDFFVPIVTPRYFQRLECRRELNLFVRGRRQVSGSARLLPILYQDLRDDPLTAADPAVADIRSMQYRDWTKVKHLERDSQPYRQGTHGIATKLVELAATPAGPLPAAADRAHRLVTSVLRGLVDVTDLLVAATAEGADPDSLVPRLKQRAPKLLAAAHVVNGDVYEAQVRASRAGDAELDAALVRLGGVLAATLDRCGEVAEAIRAWGKGDDRVRDALRPVELGLRLVADGRETIERWTGGRR